MNFDHPARYCLACRFRQELCMCAEVSRVDADVAVAVVFHTREWRKASNTGYLVRLVLEHTHLLIHGVQDRPLSAAAITPTHASDGRPFLNLMLYPAPEAVPLTDDHLATLIAEHHQQTGDATKPRVRLIVPDGNWTQARHMANRLPGTAMLPRVCLPGTKGRDGSRGLRSRCNREPGRLATAEAIAFALGAIAGDEIENSLLAAHDAAARRMLKLRGRIADLRALDAAAIASNAVSVPPGSAIA